MIDFKNAEKIILENTKVLNLMSIKTKSSLNYVLGENIYAPIDLPPFNNSAMDGYAVKVRDLEKVDASKNVVLEVIDEVQAGNVSKKTIKYMQAIKIMTGAKLPKGADGVVILENVKEFMKGKKKYIQINTKINKWQNIRFKGEDVKKGSLVIPCGRIIRPQEIAILAAMGIENINVIRRPNIGILCTGSELIDLNKKLSDGKIYNSNGYALYSLILKYNGIPFDFGFVNDNKNEIHKKINLALNFKPRIDIFIVSGGVSVGDYDFVKEILLKKGLKLKFHKVAIKPGKPLLFGILNDILIFGVPGNPAATFTSFENFIAPVILKMQGKEKLHHPLVKAKLIHPITKRDGRVHFIRGITKANNGYFITTPSGGQSSGMLKSLVDGNSLIIFPAETKKLKKGERVFVKLIDKLKNGEIL